MANASNLVTTNIPQHATLQPPRQLTARGQAGNFTIPSPRKAKAMKPMDQRVFCPTSAERYPWCLVTGGRHDAASTLDTWERDQSWLRPGRFKAARGA